MHDFSLTVEGLKIRGKLFRPDIIQDAHDTVLFIHGWESVQDRHFMLAEELACRGYTCVTFDMRGHGTSDGDHKTLSREDFLADTLAVYDFATSQNTTRRVTVIGASFGAYLAALLSVERNVQALVLRVPDNYQDTGFTEPLYEQRREPSHTLWKSLSHSDQETASQRALNTFEGDVLIVESEKDELVPASTVHSYKLAVTNTSKLTYTIMQNAPHSISHHPELQREFADIVTHWIEKI